MKIFAFSGLGVDQRVFANLNIKAELIYLPWLNVDPKTELKDFAQQYLELLPQNEKFGILGVSFGGLMAIELSKISKPEFTILISSTEGHHGIPSLFRALGKLGLSKILPSKFFIPPIWLANYFFERKDKDLLRKIILDSDPEFNKWSVNQLLQWRNHQKLNKVLHIHGKADKLIPCPNNPEIIKIANAGHFMIHDEGPLLSQILDRFITDTKS